MVNFGPNPFNRNLFQNLKQLVETVVTEELNQSQTTGPGINQNTPQPLVNRLPQAALNSATALTSLETAVFLKNLLSLPKEIQTLLLLLAFPEGQNKPESLKKLIEESPDLNLTLENVQAFLGTQSKEGVQKLVKLMQFNNTGLATEGKSFEDLLKQTTQIGAKIQTSPMEAFHTLILLYLPPLMLPQSVNISFEEEEKTGEGDGSGEGEAGGGYSLILLLDTSSLGKFKIAMGLENRSQIRVQMEHDAAAEPYLEEIQKRLTFKVAEDGIPPPTFTFLPRQERRQNADSETLHDSDPESTEMTAAENAPEGKKIAVHPSSGVSILVVHTAYTLARMIFESDDKTVSR